MCNSYSIIMWSVSSNTRSTYPRSFANSGKMRVISLANSNARAKSAHSYIIQHYVLPVKGHHGGVNTPPFLFYQMPSHKHTIRDRDHNSNTALYERNSTIKYDLSLPVSLQKCQPSARILHTHCWLSVSVNFSKYQLYLYFDPTKTTPTSSTCACVWQLIDCACGATLKMWPRRFYSP